MNNFFDRRLSTELMEKLAQGGEFAELIPAVISAGLDVQIREDSLHVYNGKWRVLSIERGGGSGGFMGSIHKEFVVDAALPGMRNGKKEYRCYPMTPDFVTDYVRLLPKIVAHTENHRPEAGKEGKVEHQMIRESIGAGSSMVLVDRQVQVHGEPGRADMVGFMPLDPAWEKGRLMLVELKQGQDNTIQNAAEQILEYYKVMTNAGKLRDEVRMSYRDVIEQKRQLGILPDWVQWPSEIVGVGCLVVLHNYTPKSTLVDRLRDSVRGQQHPPTWLVLLPEWRFDLPPQSKWEVL